MENKSTQGGKKMETYNLDVSSFWNRTNRFIHELVNCVSASTSRVSDHDLNRCKSYLNALRTLHDHIVAEPQMDWPETTPLKKPLRDAAAIPELENESIHDVVKMLEILRNELAMSQSARLPSGFIKFDSERVVMTLDKINNYIANYVETTTPVDTPESSPRAAMVDSGRRGI
jgi:hypothetical protein